MIRERIVSSLCEIAVLLGQDADGSEWHLFGSVDRNEPNAADIDLMVLCKNDVQADTLRQSISTEAFDLPLHLALLTFDEATEINAVREQRSRVIFPR